MDFVFLKFMDARWKVHVNVYNTPKVITLVKQKTCIPSGYTLILN